MAVFNDVKQFMIFGCFFWQSKKKNMSNLIVYKVNQEHQERIINVLLCHFPCLTNPFCTLSEQLYALQIQDHETGLMDMVIITEPEALISFLSKAQAVQNLSTESNMPVFSESFRTTLHHFHNLFDNHTVKLFKSLAEKGSSVSKMVGKMRVKVWKYKRIYSIEMNASFFVFSDAVALANEVLFC